MLKDHWDQEDRLRDIDEYDETGEIKKESVIGEFVLKTQIGPTGFKPKESFGTLKLNTYSINIYSILFYSTNFQREGRQDRMLLAIVLLATVYRYAQGYDSSEDILYSLSHVSI